MEESTKPIKAVLLDVDGTLIDTNDAHAKAWVEAFAQFGLNIPFAKIRPLIGMGGDQLLPRTAGVEKDSEEGKKYADAWVKIFEEKYLPEVKPFPQAAELVQRIYDQGIGIIATTSSEEKLAGALLDKVGITHLLAEKTTAKDADRSKPAPDLIEAALRKGNCTAEQSVMLGDSPYDVQATESLNVRVIALRCGGFPDAQLAGAIAIYDSPADLLAKWDQSPFAGKPKPAG
jgi:beta-phosphoglucomutase-like phosphatase (HAD superfamily)